MLQTRVMPCLLLKNSGLVKTIKFKDPSYVGDPVNAIRIYNEKEVDELIFLDITATTEQKRPNFDVISQIASECFMPVAYGGGIRDIEDARRLFSMGIEKIAINSFAVEQPDFVRKAAEQFGSQAVVVSIDAKKTPKGYEVMTHGGTRPTGLDPATFAKRMEETGAGEILINSIDRDGTLEGYDIELIRSVSSAVGVPVIAVGGAGKVEHFTEAVKQGGASAVAAGSMVVYFGRNRAVLINFPARKKLIAALS